MKGKTMAPRKLTLEDVQKLYDATMAANAAEPYSHNAYAMAEARLRFANAKYYGDALAERARDIQLDCGEVWSREKLVAYEVTEWRSELVQHVEWLVWATEDDYIERLMADIDNDTNRILALDVTSDVGAWIDLAAAKALREKAKDTLRKTDADIEHDRWLGIA